MTIAQVRVLTSDLPMYERSVATGDGATLEYQVEQYPVLTDTAKVYIDGTLQDPATDYDLDTEVGLVTFATAPAAAGAIVVTYRHAILSDDQINTLLGLESDVRLAAALALDTIASNEALVQKKIRLLDIQTDGPAVALALRAHATALREQVASGVEDGAGFDIAEWVFEPFGRRERIYKQFERGVL
ncbi:MAG TPA: hypothetical protein VIP09_02075 [Dehalococcoidia bacterium]